MTPGTVEETRQDRDGEHSIAVHLAAIGEHGSRHRLDRLERPGVPTEFAEREGQAGRNPDGTEVGRPEFGRRRKQ